MRSSLPMSQEVKLTPQAGVNINFVNTTVNTSERWQVGVAIIVERRCQQCDIVWLVAHRSHKVHAPTHVIRRTVSRPISKNDADESVIDFIERSDQ